jgi:hypothetical protein
VTAPQLVDTAAAAVAVNTTTQTIRQWRVRGKVQQYGKDGRGRGLYDLGEVYQAAARARRRGSAGSGCAPAR